MVAVCGPVLNMYDHNLASKERDPGGTLWCVSVASINVAHNQFDQEDFLESPGGPLLEEEVLPKMRDVWRLALVAFAEGQVSWPILCDMGCGTRFKGKHLELPNGRLVHHTWRPSPTFWARALVQEIREREACHIAWQFRGIIVSLTSMHDPSCVQGACR